MTRIVFDQYTVDLNLLTLTRSGLPVKLGPRAFDLLVCLIENRNRVLDRDYLQRIVWKSSAISSATIPTCILELRKALEDDAQDPTYIASIRGRGYRFIHDVEYQKEPIRSTVRLQSDLKFSGRGKELDVMLRLLRSVVAEQRGHLILLQGEAGIGKTRLIEEFIAGAGSRVAIRESVRGLQQEDKHLSAWQSLLDPIPSNKKMAPLDGANFEIDLIQFHIVNELRRIAKHKPLLLIIEDIHLCDVETQAFLPVIVKEIAFVPILVVVTYRPSLRFSSVAGEATSNSATRRCTQIDLGALEAADMQVFIPPSVAEREFVADAIFETTAGNPFLISELVRQLQSASAPPTRKSIVDTLKTENASALGRLLSALPAESKRCLVAASAIGVEFCPSLLSRVNRKTVEETLEQLAPATDLMHIEQSAAGFKFREHKLRFTIYESIPSTEKMRLHFNIAHKIAESAPTNQDSHSAVRIADHLFLSLPVATPIQVARSSAQAAALLPTADGLAYLERAHEFLRRTPSAQIEERVQVAIQLGKSWFRAGKHERARALLIETCSLAELEGTPELFANTALSLMTDYQEIEVGAYDLTLTRIIEAAIERGKHLDASTRSRLHACLAQSIRWAGNRQEHSQAADTSLALARESLDPNALNAALAAKAECLHGPDKTEERIETLREAIHLQRGKGDGQSRLLQHTRMLTALLELGDITGVDAENESCREHAEILGLPQLLWYPESTDSMRRLMEGDCRENHELRARHDYIERSASDANVSQGYATQEIFRQIEMGHATAVRSTIENFARKHRLVLGWQAAAGWVALQCGDYKASRSCLESFTPSMIEYLFREPGGAMGVALLSEIASHNGQPNEREALYDLTSGVANRAATAGYGVLYAGSFARYSGLLASSLGRHEEAVALLSLAVDHELARQATLWRAYAEIDLAIIQHRAGATQHDTKYALDKASRTCDRLKLPRVCDRLKSAKSECLDRRRT